MASLPGLGNRAARGAAVAVVLAGLVVALVLALHSYPRHGADRVRHLIAWPRDCADVTTMHASPSRAGWPHAGEVATIECEHLGPGVIYGRFPNRLALRRDLLLTPPAAPVCLAGLEVVVDYLESGQFAPVCHKLGGTKIDGIGRDANVEPTAPTMDATNRAVDLSTRAASRDQRRALQLYWHQLRP